MNKIDIFQDKEFMALPQEKQTQVLTNYFDKNMADDDFVSLPQEKQTLIKQNFINSQLNISEQEKKEAPKKVESDLKLEEPTKNSFLDKVKDFGKTYADNVADTFVGARPFGTEDKTKEIKDKAFDTVLGGLGGVQEIKEPLNIENPNPKYQELENELKQEIKVDVENQNKKIENNLIQDIENLSRIDTRLIGDATQEQKDKYLNNIAGILGKGGYALGQRDNGDYIAIDKDGNEKEIKNDFFESILDGIKADAGELTGAIYGAKKGFDISKNMKNPVAKVATIAGSSAVGSVAGTALDMGINRLKDRENNLSIEDILNEFSKSAALDIAGNAIGAGVVKVGGKIIELPKQVRDYILNGNLNGAREILKKDLGVDEKYIEDALEQAKSNYKEVKEYADKGLTDKSKQQEELLATTLEKGDANIIKGAIASNETAARNLADTIDKRTTNIFDELDNKSSKVGGEEIKNYLNNFEQTAKQDFSNMRKDFSDAFKEIDYKFELEDLKLNDTFRDMAKRVQDPDAKKRFLTLQSAIKNTIYDSNAQVGIERDISGLLDMRQQLNRFYGQNERYLTNKKDKDTFNSLKENLDNQIYKAVNDNLPPELGTRLIDSFSKSMDGYRQLGSLQENKVFKSIMGEANSPEFRLNNLVKHMADDDSYVDDVLSKMNPNARQTVEVAVIRELADSFTAKTAQGQRAIAFEDLGKQLEGIKRNVRSELGKETIDNLITYAEKFGNKDLLYLDMAKGIATKPKHNIATTIEGKVRMETASMVFQFIQSLKPGDDAKRLALQRHIGKALEKTRTPNEFATKLYEYPDLTDDSRNILKSMIKNNNKILAAKNDKDAERLLIEAQEKNQKLINDQERLKEEIENFKTPDVYESRVVSRFADDNKFASFAQLVTRIQKGTATKPDIEQYIKLKNSINPDILEKNILKEKYPENAFSIHKLNDLKSFANEKVNEIISDNEFKALIYNLDKHNKLPNTTQEIENKYREKFYQLHKLYEEEKALKEIEKQTVEDTEKKAFEEAEKAGLIPFAKFSDNLLAGTIAGVETDEDGNIVGFDPEMFVAGLGGYTIAKQSAKYLVNNFGDKLKEKAAKKIIAFIDDAENEMAKLAGGGKPPIDDKILLVQHNLSERNLKHVKNSDGILVPSIAITKGQSPLTNFGEITLLGDKEIVDPKGYAKTKVFGADIYSPRYPRATVDYKPADIRKMDKDLESYSKYFDGYSDIRTSSDVSNLKDNVAMKMKFLKEAKGYDVKLPTLNEADENLISKTFPDEYKKSIKNKGIDVDTLINDENFRHKAIEDFKKTLDLVDGNHDKFNTFTPEQLDRIIKHKADNINKIGRNSGKLDFIKLRQTVTDEVNKYGNEFDDYVNNFTSQFESKSYFYDNNTKKAFNEANVIKAMIKNLRGGEGFNYGTGSLRAMITPEFKSIKAIKDNKDRIVNSEDFKVIKEEIETELFEIADKLKPYYQYETRYRNYTDEVISALGEKGHVISSLNKAGFKDIPKDTQEQVINFIQKLQSMPTEYFEAKITRKVQPSEFSVAVVPDNASKETIDYLTQQGLKIKTYAKGDELDRKRVIEESSKEYNLLFSKFSDNLLAGTIAGVETDEDGNIAGFDPEMFVAGLGGYTIAKQSAKYLVNNFGDKLKEKAAKKIIAFMDDAENEMSKLAGGGKPPIDLGNLDKDGFYSVLEKTVDEKVGGKIDSVSLAKVLEKNGVKQDELEWSGLKDLLDSKDKLTKEEIQNTINENRLVLEKIEKGTNSKYKKYKVDGGENYRELLFKSQTHVKDFIHYRSNHWEESNIIVFTRVDDRTIENKKTLFIEELQSDWHQDGRKQGYGNKKTQVPDAPFKKNWHELGLKRMIQEAVENDYEKIAWTTGKQQADRYSLEKQIDTVVYNKQSGYLQASKNGDEVIFKKVASDEEVANLLGKEITNRLIDPKQSTRENIFVLQGEDVKFGGDGMKAFYDEIVPNSAKKLFKKYNVKPKLEELDDLEEMVWSVEITPKMKEDIKKYGQPLYAIGGTLAIGNELSNNGDDNE